MAMYRSKKNGGNEFQFYTSELKEQVRDLVKKEVALRRAITNKEFTVYFQPIYEIKSNLIMGFEVLVRWQHPELGLIMPSDFIPLAEETRLIERIGEKVLLDACFICKQWQKKTQLPLTVAVNLSSIQFRHPDIVKKIALALKETDLDPKYLEIEITESVVMENLDTTIEKFNELKKLNIAIAVDDFGTGYSSISYLKLFPIDILKIDRSFIKEIPFASNDKAIVKAIISLGHGLNLKIIAEGIETREQLEFIKTAGCDYAQGFFFNPPMSQKKIEETLLNLKE
jgi:EAL domain-containing protein (putative c-di-GMP-specific phosphodiesterase class I)